METSCVFFVVGTSVVNINSDYFIKELKKLSSLMETSCVFFEVGT
jgi:hypothetical protein